MSQPISLRIDLAVQRYFKSHSLRMSTKMLLGKQNVEYTCYLHVILIFCKLSSNVQVLPHTGEKLNRVLL